MALDTDNLLQLVRESLKRARTTPSAIVTAADAFDRLDAALCAGDVLPEDWLTDTADDDDDAEPDLIGGDDEVGEP